MANIKNIMYCEGNTDGTIGGSFYSLLYLVRGLDKSKYNPTVVFHNHHALISEYENAGIKTLIIHHYKPVSITINIKSLLFLNKIIGKIQKLFNLAGYLILSSFRYSRFLKQHKIDLLHLNNSILRNNDWMIAAFISGIPCITHERGINNHYPFIPRFISKYLKAIISISNSVTNTLINNGIVNKNIVTIYNGIDPIDVINKVSNQDMLRTLNINNEINVIGVIGNIREWKGQEVAVRAMSIITDKYPNTVCLLIGDTAPCDLAYQKRLKTIINKLGLDNKIIFTGYIKNIADYLNILQIVLHTSIEPEPFGRVLIEAMSLSKPLIAAKDGAIPEIIENEKSGLMFNPGDHEHLAQSVIRLIKDRTFAENMGQAGYKRLMDHFHIKVNVEKTQNLYTEIFRINKVN
ncbi:MAG: glycosyltransferase family 4 protein [Candidatus Thiodiazotropha sp. (ex Lucinoma borealis)]|nr:glycosyltransferase family 4 protein [Candidatus Thiodiazotropha sp. (ex Lucinoma borealis)]